jgi:cytochrome P450
MANAGGLSPERIDQIELIDLCDLDLFTNGFPHRTFAQLRDESPVWFHPPTANTPDGEGFWVVSRYDDVLAAASDSVTFSSQGGGGRDDGGTLIEDLPGGLVAGVLMNMMDDPRHQQIRKVCLPSVSARTLAGIEADLRARTQRIVADAVAEGEVDFLRAVAAELPLQAVAALLGVPQEDRHLMFEWANATLDYEDRDLGEMSDASMAKAAEMVVYGRDLIAAKQAHPTDDLLSALVGSSLAVGNDELLMFFHLLIAAGSETTRNSLAVGMDALAADPGSWRALGDDRSLLPSATEEVLRWASSATYNRRTATRDASIGSVAIGAGEKVTLWWGSANYDERAFDDPSRFDIRRDPNRHLAFGHGSHFCLGAHLARIEIRLVLDELLNAVDRVEATGPIEWVRSNKHTGVRHLPVRLVPR